MDRPPFVFRPTNPADADVSAVALALADAPFTYAPVGETRGALPAGWDQDETASVVGRGASAAGASERALRSWAMFDLGWVAPHRIDVPQEPGSIMAFTARTYGVWTINVCRVVYRLDEDDGVVRRVGFAYGTLPGHVLSGEEQFVSTWDRQTDEVVFSIRKFSRPNHPVIRALGPVIRRLQHRFSTDAIARIARAVQEEG